MAYIGKQPEFTQYPSKFFNGDGTAMTVTLDYAPPNDAALLVFIDGVRQDTSAYGCTGTSLTFTGSVPSGTNNVQVVHMGLTQDVGVPGDDTVTTAKIQDDAVTADKLANSINTEIAANTAKVTNATHTGDVTGATALTIAAGAVDIPMLSASGTASATTFLRGDNAWSAVDSLPTQTSKDGYTLVTDGTDASWTPRPNVNFLMNGTFEVAQRGTSFTPTTGSGASLMYTLDRYYGYRSDATAIMQQITDGSSPDGFRCHARMGRTDSTSDSGYFIIGQQIETKNACALAGQTVCLSMWVKKHANFSGDWGIYVTTGTGTDESAWDSIGGGWTGAATAYSSTTIFSDVTTSWVRRSISFSIASGVKEIAIKNHFSSFSGASVTNDYVEVAGMQLEIGSVPSAFNHKSYGEQLLDCQRYYEKGTYQFRTSPSITWSGNYYAYTTVIYKVDKRAAPTVTLSNQYTTDGYGTYASTYPTVSEFGLTATGSSVSPGWWIKADWISDAEL